MIASFFAWVRSLPLGAQALVTICLALLLSALIVTPIVLATSRPRRVKR